MLYIHELRMYYESLHLEKMKHLALVELMPYLQKYQLHVHLQLDERKNHVSLQSFLLTGSAIIVSYGIFRLDPVIILGQSFGFVSYIRNLVISHRSKKG